MKRPARLLLSGYYGFGNAGDEAILAGLVESFRTAGTNVELTVLSGDPEATESEHGVRAVPRGLTNAYRWARRSDLLVSGGGGLLQDTTSLRSPLYYLGEMRLARAAGTPVACLGHGIGPLNRSLARLLTRRVLSRVDTITVRDHASRQALQKLGVTRDIEVTADLAFLLPEPSREESDAAWCKGGLPQDDCPKAAIALREPPQGEQPDFGARLAEALSEACQHLGLRPLFLPMHRGRDERLAAECARALPEGARIVTQQMRARELLALVGQCDLMIAMRLHAIIFAAICGVPPVAISYDPKVEALMQQLDLQPATATDQFDPSALSSAIHETWRRRAEISGSLRPRAERLRQAAARNIQLALALVADDG
jgi:polysaccharide pyruvyl transferase CsaB